ncbi:alpha/beta fold hydrolase, partial [Pseudomonas aeruginosa]
LGRREAFPDLEEARAYFSGKALFRRFDPDCLEAYVRHGLADSGGGSGLRLRFDPATEISIYRSVPHSSPGRARHRPDQPGVVRQHHLAVPSAHPRQRHRQQPRTPRA